MALAAASQYDWLKLNRRDGDLKQLRLNLPEGRGLVQEAHGTLVGAQTRCVRCERFA